jgi:two-component system sensor histidine kinase HydH
MENAWQPGDDPDGDEPGVRPLVLALALATVYALLCGSYIVLSGRIVAERASDVGDLAQMELLKGLGFVASTALVFFAFAWFLLRRLAARQRVVLAQRRALVVADRRALAGLFCASVAHDINNVLTVANGQLEQLGPHGAPERRGPALEAVRGALGNLAALVKRLVSLQRAGGEEAREPVDLVRVARETAAFAARHPRVRGCRVSVAAVRPVVVRANATALGRVVLNLLLNAAEATNGKGDIEVRVFAEGANARLEVHDDGPGVPAELRERVLAGFFTTKPEGSGLGLLSVRVSAAEHGGSLVLGDSDLGGAVFAVTLPAERS